MSKLKFLKDDGHGALRATVGGVLLLAADDAREWLPNAWIQAVCYGGDRMDAGRQLDARDVTGPLDRADFARLSASWSGIGGVAAYKEPARVDVPQFSERAVFEAVVNAGGCIATSRSSGPGYACSCSTIGWSCTAPAGCAIP